MQRRRKPITIVDVAHHAGVSVGSVSRVLNHASNCAPELKKRVQKSVRELGYVPNHVARSLKRQKTEQLELVIPDIANPVYVAMAKAVQQTARRQGYRMSVVSTENNPLEEGRAIKNLERRHVDGLIICSLKVTDSFVAQVEAAKDRVCVIGTLPDHAAVDSVRVDSEVGVGLAIKHLADSGRRRIAFINGEMDTVPSNKRLAGYQTALSDLRLPFESQFVRQTDFTMQGGYNAAELLLEYHPEIDAIFCANDLIALGVLRKVQEHGKRVPHDIAVVGMDNIDMTRVSSPTLTTDSLLAEERGRLATELLLERLEKPEVDLRKLVITPRLVIRESSTGYIAGLPRDAGYVSF